MNEWEPMFVWRAETAKECSISRKAVITTSNAGTGVPLISEMGQAALLALPAGKAEQEMVWRPTQCQSGRHAHTHTLTCTTAHTALPDRVSGWADLSAFRQACMTQLHNFRCQMKARHTARHTKLWLSLICAAAHATKGDVKLCRRPQPSPFFLR